jgi:TetR/AcrR family transcriptional regulator
VEQPRRKIAAAAGVSEAMVFRHFSTKSELYDAILDDKHCHEGIRFRGKKIRSSRRRWSGATIMRCFTSWPQRTYETGIGRAFHALLFYSALEEHELAERFFSEFVSRVYEFIGGYVKRRQEEGAMRDVNPRIVVRAFLGMTIHHSLNLILWDKKRTLLNITNEEAAKNFAEIILYGVAKS